MAIIIHANNIQHKCTLYSVRVYTNILCIYICIMCYTLRPLLVHDQRGTCHDVDDDDKRSRSEDLVRDPRVREVPVVIDDGGVVVSCYSGRVGRDYFACLRGTGGGFLIALILWCRPNGSKVWSAPTRGRERTKRDFTLPAAAHSTQSPAWYAKTHTQMLANIILYDCGETTEI